MAQRNSPKAKNKCCCKASLLRVAEVEMPDLITGYKQAFVRADPTQPAHSVKKKNEHGPTYDGNNMIPKSSTIFVYIMAL